MSQEKDLHEARRWFETAREDLMAAEAMATMGFFPHSCFLARQAAEKAVKACGNALGKAQGGILSNAL